ncbi:unnamed protein product [Rhodiola kirilowii]
MSIGEFHVTSPRTFNQQYVSQKISWPREMVTMAFQIQIASVPPHSLDAPPIINSLSPPTFSLSFSPTLNLKLRCNQNLNNCSRKRGYFVAVRSQGEDGAEAALR